MTDLHRPRTFYVNRVLDLPPLVAQAAFDAQEARRDSAGQPHAWRVRAATAQLRLERRVLTTSQPECSSGPFRVERGVVQTKWQRLAVELELVPWSRDRTELGLRPIRPAFAPIQPPNSYLRAGHELLTTLAAQMSAWADQPLLLLWTEDRQVASKQP